ncbi:hypothetical protein J5500_01020 [Candidatus Saccharibacteria bacterium]|nr:hypothetical protein [Candidatus Saccharibacteria bacterium]
MNPENRYFGSAAPNPEPAPQPTGPTPQPSVANLASSAKPEPKSKKPLIITIVIVVLIVIIGVVLTIVLNQPQEKKEENDNQENAKEEKPAEIITEYKDESRLKKSIYTIDDINSGFIYGDFAFAGTDEVKVRQVVNELVNTDGGFYLSVANANNEYGVHVKSVPSGTTIRNLSDACDEQDNCDSDFIEGAKTLITTTVKSQYSTEYAFYSTIGDQLVSFIINASKSDNLDESAARSLLIKTAMTVSPASKSDKPYIFDMVARIKLPFGKKVKSYKDINEVSQDDFVVFFSDESSATTYIHIRHQPVDGVTTTEVSSDPKIESYSLKKIPYFRFYDNETPYDITIFIDNAKGERVKDAKKAQEYIDKIGK